MSQKLEIKAFFFNAKTDYLPYHKIFTVYVPKDATARSILEAVKAQNENFSFPELNLVFKLNRLVVEENTPVTSIVEKLGTSLQIDPVSSYKSNNGLIINNNDFMKSFDLLAPYATKSDKKYYKTLYALHYASETSHFDREYIGDAILVLAHKMISEGNEHKTEILNAITSVSSGLLDCEYENNLFNPQHHTATITALKEMVKNDDDDDTALSLVERIKKRFGKQTEKITLEIPLTQKHHHTEIDNITDKNIAYYAGNIKNPTMEKLLEEANISTIDFSRAHKLSGLTIIQDNRSLAFKKAGATLLDAFDAGAEVIIVEDKATYKMMYDNFSKIENEIGRQIIGLELISSKDFETQINSMTVLV